MKTRLEDLGRISEILRALMDHSLFRHTKNSHYRFTHIMKSEDEVENLFYQIEAVLQQIQQCFQIARYGDPEDQKK